MFVIFIFLKLIYFLHQVLLATYRISVASCGVFPCGTGTSSCGIGFSKHAGVVAPEHKSPAFQGRLLNTGPQCGSQPFQALLNISLNKSILCALSPKEEVE